MKEILISFETAQLAKKKGFNIYQPTQFSKGVNSKTMYNYNENRCRLFKDTYYAPTQSLLEKWLRDEHKIFINIKHIVFNQKFGYSITGAYQNGEQGILKSYDWTKFESYEECLENALVEALNFITL